MSFTIKDALIIIASFILVICIFKIRKLKKSLAQQVRKQLIPQLILKIDDKDLAINIKNESFFLVQSIKIEDVQVALDDFGFKLSVILKFEHIDFIKPNETVKLRIKACDRNQNFLPDLTEKLIPHLVSVPFKITMYFSNIEGLKFRIVFNKRKDNFFAERIDSLSKSNKSI